MGQEMNTGQKKKDAKDISLNLRKRHSKQDTNGIPPEYFMDMHLLSNLVTRFLS